MQILSSIDLHAIILMKMALCRAGSKVTSVCFANASSRHALVLLPMQPYLAATLSKAVQQPDFTEPTIREWAGKPISRSFKLEIKKAVHNLNGFLGMPDDGTPFGIEPKPPDQSPCAHREVFASILAGRPSHPINEPH